MPIRAMNAPDDITAKIADDLGALARTRGEASLSDIGGSLGAPIVSLPVYGISRDLLERGGNAALGDAKQIGWRYLVQDRDGAGLVDRFGTAADGSSRIIRGSSVDRYGKAGLVAEAETPENIAFEPRVLDFGVLGQTELWLHSDHAEDRFYSLGAAEPVRRDGTTVMTEALRRAGRHSLVGHKEHKEVEEQEEGITKKDKEGGQKYEDRGG